MLTARCISLDTRSRWTMSYGVTIGGLSSGLVVRSISRRRLCYRYFVKGRRIDSYIMELFRE